MPKPSYLICCVALGMMHTSVRSANAADLNYQAPPACPDREELSFRITRALAKPFEEVPATRFEVAVRATTSGFGATLRVETFEGDARERTSPEGGLKERYLEAGDCSQLIDAVSVAVVLALGALENTAPENPAHRGTAGPTREGTASGVSSSADLSMSAAVRDDSKPPALPTSDATTVRPGVFIWMLGDVGSLPSAGLGAGIGAHVAWSSWRVRAHASVIFDQHVDVPSASAVEPGADLGLAVGGLALCRSSEDLQLGSWILALCLGGELGRLSGRGTNVVPERSGGAFWAAPLVDGSARFDLGAGAGLDLMLGAALPLTRNPFIIDEIGRIHRSASLAGRGALGLSWNFR
jgi:hypothetical protein